MNEGQKMFYGFIMEIVKPEKKEQAEKLLKQCFDAQNAGTFDKDFLFRIMPELRSYVKEEGIPKLEQAMQHFSSTL